jgi:hypothetical protein
LVRAGAKRAALAAGGGGGGGAGGGAALPGRPIGLLAKAREADPALGADGDLPLLLAAGPVREAMLRLIGVTGLGALMATRRALQRDVHELAMDVAWREGERKREFGPLAVFRVKTGRVAEWAARFPLTRALAVGRRWMTPALAVSVTTAACSLRMLETLDLCDCKIGAMGTASLAAALTAASAAALPFGLRLTKLDMRNNGIGAAGATSLAEALLSCTQLASLNVAENNIGTAGAVALAKALPAWKHLASLDVRNNDIGNEGAAALANALPACTQLASLNMSENGIGVTGAAALASMLVACAKLTLLRVSSNNDIGAEGEATLRAAGAAKGKRLMLLI